MKHLTSSVASLALATVLCSAPRVAWASDSAAAIAAFDEAEKLLAAGEITQACDKFAQSYSLDPQLGALLHAADCREQAGQLASAWSAFRDAAEVAEQRADERKSLAEERAQALAARVSKLTIHLPANVPKGTTVSLNGKSLPPGIRGSELPVDGGHYMIEVSAPGYDSFQGSVDVGAEGDRAEITVPPLKARPEPAPEPLTAPWPTEDRSLFEAKWPAFASLGVGVAGGVIWTIFGVISMDAKSAADSQCGVDARYCVIDGVEQRGRAYDAGTMATVGAVVTGVGLAGAGVLWFALPGPSHSTTGQRSNSVALGVQSGGLTLRGAF